MFGGSGKVAKSLDGGATWTDIGVNAAYSTNRLMAAAYGGDRWVLLNNNGELYYSNCRQMNSHIIKTARFYRYGGNQRHYPPDHS
jgi:hypothetical protein